MHNVLVTGANGQLGSEIQKISVNFSNAYRFFYTDKADLDITKIEEIDLFVKKNKISIIINCAAYTAVDTAEEATELADLINHKAVKSLGEIAQLYGLKLVHVSTDYVFNGAACIPYNVNELTAPQSVYGVTKLAGEKALQDLNLSNTIIIRTAWVYSEFGANFVKTMLKLGKERTQLNVIYDQIGSPTYALDLAQTILEILPKITNDQIEVYHYTNEGVCSWFDFAKAIFEISQIDCNVAAIPSSAYPTKARRPHYSVLNKEKIKDEFNVTIPYWRDSLKECLKRIDI